MTGRLSPDIEALPDFVSLDYFADLVADTRLRVFQTSRQIEGKIARLINDQLFAHRPDLMFRIHSCWDTDGCADLSFLREMPDLRIFSADYLREVKGIDAVTTLSAPTGLGIGVYGLSDFNFLNDLDGVALSSLSLMATRSKKPRIDAISRFTRLETLFLEGQQEGIETIAGLKSLRDITLRSVSVPDFGFLRSLSNLWSLDIKLGGSKNLAELAQLKGLKYLELWQIKGLKDLSPISEIAGLQFLFLQSLAQVEQLPDLSRLCQLRRIVVDNLKALTSLAPLETAPALEDVIVIDAKQFKPSDFAGLLRKSRAVRLSVGFGSRKKNEELRRMMDEKGVASFQRSDFVFE